MSYRKNHVKNKINSNRPKKSIFKMPIFWFSLLFFVLILAGLYLFLFCSKVQVQTITISGNQKISSDNLKNIISNNANKKLIGFGNWGIFSKSIFLVNSESIKNEILNLYPEIKTATIEKKFMQEITLQVEERQKFATFCQNENCFDIDNSGVIFEKSQNSGENNLIVRQALNNGDLFLGQQIIQENIMTAIFEIEKNLKDNFQINLTEALLSTQIRLDIKTGESWQIYFDVEEGYDIGLQLTKLNLLLKDEIKPESRQKLQYIDLRFKNRAYYK